MFDVEGQVGRLELEALGLGLSLQGLNLQQVEPEHVWDVVNGQFGRMEG